MVILEVPISHSEAQQLTDKFQCEIRHGRAGGLYALLPDAKTYYAAMAFVCELRTNLAPEARNEPLAVRPHSATYRQKI